MEHFESNADGSGMKLHRGYVLPGLLIGYIAVLLVAGGVLMAAHDLPLSTPKMQQATNSTIPGPWRVYHVLVEDCDCSNAVLNHLLHRKAVPNTVEEICILTDAHPVHSSTAYSIAEAGYSMLQIDRKDAFGKLGVSGGPVLLIENPAGARLYSGGYGAGRATRLSDESFYQDINLLQSLQSGLSVKRLVPVGCSIQQPFESILK